MPPPAVAVPTSAAPPIAPASTSAAAVSEAAPTSAAPVSAPAPAPAVEVLPLPAPLALPPEPMAPPSKMHRAAWGLVAATVGLLTAGAILGLAAQERADEISRQETVLDASNMPRVFDMNLQKTFQDLRSEGQTYNAAGISLMAAGGAAAIVAGALFIFDYRTLRAGDRRVQIVPSLAAGHAGLAASLEF
jgi:hypothetical protein